MDGFTTPIVDFTDQMPEGHLVINASSPGAIENSAAAGVESVQRAGNQWTEWNGTEAGVRNSVSPVFEEVVHALGLGDQRLHP